MIIKNGSKVGYVGRNEYCGFRGKVIGAYDMMGEIVYVVKLGISPDCVEIDCLAQELIVINKGGVAK